MCELIRLLGVRKKQYAIIAGIFCFLLLGQYINSVLHTKTVSSYHTYFTDKKSSIKKKKEGWFWRIPEEIQKGIRPGLRRHTLFLIENTTQDMTVGMRDIGLAGYISKCRVYDQDMLVNKYAQALAKVLRSGNEGYIRDFIWREMRGDLENQSPDFYLYPQVKMIVSQLYRWDWFDQMYTGYFTDHMDLIERFQTAKKLPFAYYRKKGLSWRPSPRELIRKYEEIVRENPSYPVFRDRLNELYRQTGQEVPQL